MPWTPTAERLSFTSSSLNGLMIASTFFMDASSAGAAGKRRALRQPLLACKADPHASTRSFRHLRDAEWRALRRADGTRPVPASEATAEAAGREQVGVLAVLREVESRELIVLVHTQPARHRGGDAEAEERA